MKVGQFLICLSIGKILSSKNKSFFQLTVDSVIFQRGFFLPVKNRHLFGSQLSKYFFLCCGKMTEKGLTFKSYITRDRNSSYIEIRLAMPVREFSLSQALIYSHPSLDRFFADIKGFNVVPQNPFFYLRFYF